MLQNGSQKQSPLYIIYRFLKDSLATEILKETGKGVCFCFILQHAYKVLNLRSDSNCIQQLKLDSLSKQKCLKRLFSSLKGQLPHQHSKESKATLACLYRTSGRFYML